MQIRFRSPVTRELRAFRGYNVPRPADAGDAFYVTSPFGLREDGFHGGLDIGNARTGYDLVATADGEVLAVGYLKEPWSASSSAFGTGNFGGLMVILLHAPRVASIYAHMSNRSVSAGQLVKAGQRIGAIGDSGSAKGQAHVHFGIQAPSAPAGVASKSTDYGFGLDIDPWPLLTGTPLNVEDDVEIPVDLTRTPNRIGTIEGSRAVGIRIRQAPVDGSVLVTLPAQDFPFMSLGHVTRPDGLWRLTLFHPEGAAKPPVVGWVRSDFTSELREDEPRPVGGVAKETYDAAVAKFEAAENTVAQLKTKISAAQAALK